MSELWDFITARIAEGWPPLAIIALAAVFYLLFYPEKAEKVGLWFKAPLFKFFRWCSHSYISSSISVSVSDFVNKELLQRFDEASFSKVKVKFNLIRSTEEINLHEKKMIIRLNESNDQTRNKLAAASLAIPKIVCPYIRSNLDVDLNKAIDLTVLRKFADRLGNHGSLVFKENFLDPEILASPVINELIEKLLKIDKVGYFISIFANELNSVGKGIYSRSDITNKSADVVDFLNYLLRIAEREEREETELAFRSTTINVNIVLLALTDKAEQFGPEPYRNRLKRNFREGAESNYVVAFPRSWDFLGEVLKLVAVDQRFTIVNTYDLGRKNVIDEKVRISLIRANEKYSDTTFADQLKDIDFHVGSRTLGIVNHLSTHNAIVTLGGLSGFINKDECDWFALESCSEKLTEGEEFEFEIKDIVLSTGSIELTRRFKEDDPWKDVTVPAVGEIIDAEITADLGPFLIAKNSDGLEIRIPNIELCWGERSMEDVTSLIGKTTKVLIIAAQPTIRLLRGSLKRLPAASWDEVKARFGEGTTVMGSVIAVNSQYATVELSSGFVGRVTKESFYAAGHEFRDFENNLALGQKLEVVVKKVWTGRQKISLELKRNAVNRELPEYQPIEPIEHKIVRMPGKILVKN